MSQTDNPMRLVPAIASAVALIVTGLMTAATMLLAMVQLTTLPSSCRPFEDPNACAGRQLGEVIGTVICPCFCVGMTLVLLVMTVVLMRRSSRNA